MKTEMSVKEQTCISCEVSNKVRLLRFMWIVFYFLPFFVWDDYNIIPLFGSYCLYKLFCSIKGKDGEIVPVGTPARSEKVYLITVIVLEVFFSYVFRFVFSDLYGIGSISFGDFNVIPTFIFWIELALVLFFYLVINKEKVFGINAKALLFSVLILIPFVYSTALSVISIKTHGESIELLTPVECLNSSYRAFVLAGLIEELFYRGLIYDGMKRFFNAKTAILLQAVFFSLIHSRQMVSLFETGDINIVINFICVFFLGVISARIRDYTKSFLPSIILHGCLNGGIYYLGLLLVQ